MAEDAIELKHISWKDEGWIARAGVLTTLNALEYFSNSPFFSGSAKRDDLIASRRTQRLLCVLVVCLSVCLSFSMHLWMHVVMMLTMVAFD